MSDAYSPDADVEYYEQLSDEEAKGQESDVEFSEEDKKIMQLYEIVNELVEEQKARTHDLYLLQQGENVKEMMQVVEIRSDNMLQALYKELELNKDPEDDDDEEEENEEDAQLEIYNTLVRNFNEYLEAIADFMAAMEETRSRIISGTDPDSEEEIQELEAVLLQQTEALTQQMKRNDELEGALQSVLTEYSTRINSSNAEISNLHRQLSRQNESHQQQLADIKIMYEKQLDEIRDKTQMQYKREIDQLLDTISSSRTDFRDEIEALTRQMHSNQMDHKKEVLELSNTVALLQFELKEAQSMQGTGAGPSWEEKHAEEIEELVDSLMPRRTELDIDEEDDYDKMTLNRIPMSKSTPGLNVRNLNLSKYKYLTQTSHDKPPLHNNSSGGNRQGSPGARSNGVGTHRRNRSREQIPSGQKYFRSTSTDISQPSSSVSSSQGSTMRPNTIVGSSILGGGSNKSSNNRPRIGTLEKIGKVGQIGKLGDSSHSHNSRSHHSSSHTNASRRLPSQQQKQQPNAGQYHLKAGAGSHVRTLTPSKKEQRHLHRKKLEQQKHHSALGQYRKLKEKERKPRDPKQKIFKTRSDRYTHHT